MLSYEISLPLFCFICRAVLPTPVCYRPNSPVITIYREKFLYSTQFEVKGLHKKVTAHPMTYAIRRKVVSTRYPVRSVRGQPAIFWCGLHNIGNNVVFLSTIVTKVIEISANGFPNIFREIHAAFETAFRTTTFSVCFSRYFIRPWYSTVLLVSKPAGMVFPLYVTRI